MDLYKSMDYPRIVGESNDISWNLVKSMDFIRNIQEFFIYVLFKYAAEVADDDDTK
jgi:hypothetical protein